METQKHLNLALPDTLLKDLDSCARREKKNRTELIRSAVESYLYSTVLNFKPDTLKKIDRIAKQQGVTRIDVVRSAVNEFMLEKEYEEAYASKK